MLVTGDKLLTDGFHQSSKTVFNKNENGIVGTMSRLSVFVFRYVTNEGSLPVWLQHFVGTVVTERLLTLKAWAAIGEAARDEGRENDALMLRVCTTVRRTIVRLASPVAVGRISYHQIHVLYRFQTGGSLISKSNHFQS